MKISHVQLASMLGALALMAWAAAFSMDAARPISAAEMAFEDACRLSGYDCSGVEPPILRYADFYGIGLDGAFFGGRIIYVLDTLKHYPDRLRLVLTHETVHYLQWRVGQSAIPTTSRLHLCVMEQEAYRVAATLAVEMGRDELAPDESVDPRCSTRQPASKVIAPEFWR